MHFKQEPMLSPWCTVCKTLLKDAGAGVKYCPTCLAKRTIAIAEARSVYAKPVCYDYHGLRFKVWLAILTRCCQPSRFGWNHPCTITRLKLRYFADQMCRYHGGLMGAPYDRQRGKLPE